jgi:hypothetical protein
MSDQHAQASRPSQSSVDSIVSQFDDEIEMLKGAAISAITTILHDSIRSYLPAMGKYLDDGNTASSGASPPATNYGAAASTFGRTPSTATNTAYDTGAERASFDSPPPTTSGQTSQLSNPEAGGTGSYYPPGSPGVANRDYVKTYHPPSESEHERAVGEDTGYWREA